MNLTEFKKKSLKLLLRQASLCFLVRGDEILLAMKKRGFGEGRWNGVGGKPDLGETIDQTAIREAQEEIRVTPKSIKRVAVLDFYFPYHPEWSQRVFVYFSDSWEGDPAETEEMSPKWYRREEIPFNLMWPDDIFWLPLVLRGSRVYGEFLFGENDALLDTKVSEVEAFNL